MKTALREFEGDIEELLQDRLGDWIGASTQNSAYLLRLADAVTEAGIAAGLFAPEDEDDEDGDDQGEPEPTNPVDAGVVPVPA